MPSVFGPPQPGVSVPVSVMSAVSNGSSGPASSGGSCGLYTSSEIQNVSAEIDIAENFLFKFRKQHVENEESHRKNVHDVILADLNKISRVFIGQEILKSLFSYDGNDFTCVPLGAAGGSIEIP
uniref:Uncharacterized protein n=1 Tax=Parascaris equorum TaxID=6256 RepID=A0A914R5X5_PAREQ